MRFTYPEHTNFLDLVLIAATWCSLFYAGGSFVVT
jgi:hypothetical protein